MRQRTCLASHLLAAALMLLGVSCVFDRGGLLPPDAGGPRPDSGGPGQDSGGPGQDSGADAGGCTDLCAPAGSLGCAPDRRTVRICQTGAGGCTEWVTHATCDPNDLCADPSGGEPARCAPCGVCTPGEATCATGEVAVLERCVLFGDSGCTTWETVACGPGALCQEGTGGAPATCESCVDCTDNTPRCRADGLAVERCDLDAVTGCRAWASFPCPTNTVCVPGEETEVCSSDSIAGPTDMGSASPPSITLGNTATGDGHVAKNYLVGDKVTTTVPLTALQIHTRGTAGGNVKISIYDHNATDDLPGSRLFGEVTSAVAANAWTTISLPARAYLPAGTYWIVFIVSTDKGITYSSTTGGERVFRQLNYASGLPATAGSGFTRSTSIDSAYIAGIAVQGYAKATRITLTETTMEAGALSVYTHTPGSIRLALYAGGAAPQSRLWESPAAAAVAASWTTLPISAGTPTSLALGPGTYWLAWQWDALGAGPGYLPGGGGDGHYIVQPFGPFPASWTGGTPTSETWSLHLGYTAFSPPVGW